MVVEVASDEEVAAINQWVVASTLGKADNKWDTEDPLVGTTMSTTAVACHTTAIGYVFFIVII